MNRITEVLVFTLDDQQFALPLEVVERVIRAVAVTPLPSAPESILGIINMQGRILCVLNLRQRCRRPAREVDPDDWFILVHTPSRTVVLPVDSARVTRCDPGRTLPSGFWRRALGRVH